MKETNDQSIQNSKENTIDILVTPNKKSAAPSAPAKKSAESSARPAEAKKPARSAEAKKPVKPAAAKAPLAKKASETRAVPTVTPAKKKAPLPKTGAKASAGAAPSAATAAAPAKKIPLLAKSLAALKKPIRKNPAKKEKAPAEKEPRTPIASTLIIALVYIAVVVGISAVLSICGIRWANDIFALAKDEVVATVTIPENATVSEVSVILEEAGIIEYPGVFRFYINFKNRKADPPLAFKAGSYELRSTLNFDQIVSLIKERKARGIIKLTIPEGYTVDEIIDLFVSKGMGTREGFVDAINNYDYQNYTFMEKLKAIELSPERKYRLEGYLFPDTYEFYADSGEVAIIDKMLAAFDSRFENDYYARLEELGMNVDQVITLASIVQKEGKFSSDFYPVAGVFYNRLNSKNMTRLQSDATVQYCLEERKAELSYADLEVDSPYNTYRNSGLPPSAISNPGWEAIQAALYPEQHKHLFFISDTDGSMIFADTEAQHSANAAKLREAKENGTSID